MKRTHDENGYTLLEMLCALSIGSIMVGVLVYVTLFEMDSLSAIRSGNEVNSSVQSVDQVLQKQMQNLKTIALDPEYPAGTAIIGTDTSGSNVEIRLEGDSAQKVGGQVMVGFEVLTTPSMQNTPSVVTHLRGTETSFANSTFHVLGSVDGTNALVSLHLVATYIGPSTNQSITRFVIDTSYAVGGGY